MRAPDTVSNEILLEAMRKRIRNSDECLCDRCIYPARTILFQLRDAVLEDHCPNRVNKYIEKNPGCLQKPDIPKPSEPSWVTQSVPEPSENRFDLIRHQFPNWDRK